MLPVSLCVGIQEIDQRPALLDRRELSMNVPELDSVLVDAAEKVIALGQLLRVCCCQLPVKDDPAHARGIHGDPAPAGQIELGPAVLLLGNRSPSFSLGMRMPQISRAGPQQGYEHGMEIGALTHARGKQAFDIAKSAGLGIRVPLHIVDDPFIDRPCSCERRFFDVRDLAGLLPDLLLGLTEPGQVEILPQFGAGTAVAPSGRSEFATSRRFAVKE